MKKHPYLMAVAIAAVAFASCVKEPAFLANVTYPEGTSDNVLVVDAWSKNFPLEIKTEGEWRVECSDFISVKPKEGKGNATVKVYLEDNCEEQRQKGNVTIVFPGHEKQNKVLAVEQKWAGEYDENASVIGNTNAIYAVGYGYDTTKGLYANMDCVKSQIFQTGKLIDEGYEGIRGSNIDAVISTVTGSSISELSNKLTVKANVSGGFSKFKAEAHTSFDMEYSDNSTHEYAINYLEATVATATFEIGVEDLATEEWMTSYAYKNINGLNDKYPSGKEGFAALIRNYGTHVVMSARLGGRVRQSLDIDISNIKTSYDLNVFAKASYEGVMAKAEGSANDDFHISYNDNKESTKIKVQALGGDSKMAKTLAAPGGFTKDNYENWFYSVDGANMTLMGFVDNDSLIPLYDLVDKKKYPDRYDDLFRFMTGKEMKEVFEDNSTYDSGTITKFKVPAFGSSYKTTLVKDIKLGGQLVGQVCEEYIPAINRDKRVIVVYPVIGTTVRYNMGFFIGDDTHKPARVAWDGTDTHIVEYPDLKFGTVDSLYLRGASISATDPQDVNVKDGTLQDEFLEGLKCMVANTTYGTVQRNTPGNYPLVKIFDKIWTREEYTEYINGSSGHSCQVTMDGNSVSVGREYYTKALAANSDIFPKGWRVAELSDYTEMTNKLVANGFSMPGKGLFNGGVTGFETYFVGFCYDTGDWHGSTSEMYYITSDGKYFLVKSTGAISSGNISNNKYCIRLIKQ